MIRGLKKTINKFGYYIILYCLIAQLGGGEYNTNKVSNISESEEVPIIDLNKSKVVTKAAKIKHNKVLEKSKVKYYAYSRLNKEEKNLYNKLYNCIKNHKKSVVIPNGKSNKVKKVYDCIMMDHSDIFYIDGYSKTTLSSNFGSSTYTFKPIYTFSKNKVKKYKKRINKNVKLLLSGINNKMTAKEKEKYVYEVLAKNVEYDLNSPNNQNIVSSLVNGKSVCAGYARATQYLLQKLGIECIVVSGYANNGDESGWGRHDWNKVKIGKKWYNVDTTWGDKFDSSDGYSDYIDYKYFNATNKELRKTHKVGRYKIKLPVCN